MSEGEPIKWKKGSIEANRSVFGGEVQERDLATYIRELNIDPADLEGKKVLDVGAGLTAKIARELEGKADVIALSPDYAAEQYREAVKDLPGQAVAGVGQALPFGEGTFDTILMLHVTEHTSSEELGKMVKEAVRTLKAGGKIYIGPLLEHENVRDDITPIKRAVEEAGALVTFEENGEKTRFDLREDLTGPHHYIYVNQQRAKITKN